MSEHTPGPWSISNPREEAAVIGVENDSGWITINDADGSCIGSMYMLSEEQNGINARLAAAAPEMLEALKAMVDRWEPDCDGQDRIMWENARAAIARAEGRA